MISRYNKNNGKTNAERKLSATYSPSLNFYQNYSLIKSFKVFGFIMLYYIMDISTRHLLMLCRCIYYRVNRACNRDSRLQPNYAILYNKYDIRSIYIGNTRSHVSYTQ